MPELPDVRLYVDLLVPRLRGATLRRVRVRGVSVLRTVEPPPDAGEGGTLIEVSRLGKQLVLAVEPDLYYVFHLMIAGRLRWSAGAVPAPSKIDQAAIEFSTGTLTLTEAGTRKRAVLRVVRGVPALRALDRGGLDILTCEPDDFRSRLCDRNRTLKRALTDPRSFDGVGNAYSDEILHAARLSPLKRTDDMSDDECARLFLASRDTLETWTRRLREEFGLNPDGSCRAEDDHGRFPGPGQVTAFRPGFAVHGRYAQPCPVCSTRVQRILYAENECNYCPRCQTGGRVLADRALSRLLKGEWPRTVEELEEPG